jgi:hypothetical protein
MGLRALIKFAFSRPEKSVTIATRTSIERIQPPPLPILVPRRKIVTNAFRERQLVEALNGRRRAYRKAKVIKRVPGGYLLKRRGSANIFYREWQSIRPRKPS